jgi:V/A-type H+-transporting ATPase subunit I
MFYLVGWVPASSVESFKRNVESEKGFYCLTNDPEDVKSISPPIKRKTSFFSSIFTPFLEMYGLPSYKEIDPGFFFALTYTFMFGIMYGDVGQGISLIIIGIIMYMTKGSWLGKMLACFGISSTAFGFVYGSVFGYEHILPGLKVLEGENMMRVLMAAVALGIFILIFSMGLNIVNGIRQKNIDKIFFSPNGLAGATAYTATVAGAVSTAFFGKNLFTVPYIICLIVLPLLAVFLREPLTHLVESKRIGCLRICPAILLKASLSFLSRSCPTPRTPSPSCVSARSR